MNGDSAAQRSLAAAVRQLLNQVGRLLEEQQPSSLLVDNGPVVAALVSWRQAVEAQTSGLSIEKARALEIDKLRLMGEVGALKKEAADLRERNEQLRAEIVRLNQREQDFRQQLLDAEFRGGGARAQAKTLDLEIRDLRRQIRELEGGPPLKPSEAAPQSLDKLQALFSGKKPEPPVADSLQAPHDTAEAEARPVGTEDPPKPPSKKKIRKTSRRKEAAPAPSAEAPATAPEKVVNKPISKGKVATGATPAKKVPAKKARAKKAAPKKPSAKKAPAKKASAKKAPAPAAPAKKAPTRKAPPEKAAPKRRVSRKKTSRKQKQKQPE